MARQPVLFIGHGSPMNAIADNEWTRAIQSLGSRLERPKAILVISAHWLTAGTWITSTDRPRMIYDMGGFPEELYKVRYPAPGDPALAQRIQQMIPRPRIQFDGGKWGLDHGAWSVLMHLFPKADIPVLQLSMDMAERPEFHFDLGRQLRALRDEGVLIVASGNIVHNLRKISWNEKETPTEWGVEFDQWVRGKLQARDFDPLVNQFLKAPGGALSVPTPDHYFPMLYTLGASDAADGMKFEFEGMQNASISMRSFSLSVASE